MTTCADPAPLAVVHMPHHRQTALAVRFSVLLQLRAPGRMLVQRPVQHWHAELQAAEDNMSSMPR